MPACYPLPSGNGLLQPPGLRASGPGQVILQAGPRPSSPPRTSRGRTPTPNNHLPSYERGLSTGTLEAQVYDPHGATTTEDMRFIADRLRQQNTALTEVYRNVLATSNRAEPSVHERAKDSLISFGEPFVEGDNSVTYDSGLAELSRDLRSAVQRTVERRKLAEESHLEAEAAFAQERELLQQEICTMQLEAAAIDQRVALEADLLGHGGLAPGQLSPNGTAITPESAALAEDLRVARVACDFARNRRFDLSDEFRAFKETEEQDVLRIQEERELRLQRAAMLAPVRDLQDEVRTLREELKGCELSEDAVDKEMREEVRWLASAAPEVEAQARERGGGDYARLAECTLDQWQAQLSESTTQLVEGQARVRLGEVELAEDRARAQQLGDATAAEAKVAAWRHAECRQLRGHREEYRDEELVLRASLAQLHKEIGSLSQHYEQQKRLLGTYTAALARPPPCVRKQGMPPQPPRPSGQQGSRGVVALIRMLAQMCGSPEVAFLAMDVRKSGRLSPSGLNLGLLLGLGLDYVATTGLKLRTLFAALDQRGGGFITSGDLAACHPEEWRTHGGVVPTALEKVASLPWVALGGIREACDQAMSDPDGAGRRSAGSKAPEGSISWPGFEELVCQRLLGFDVAEAGDIFGQLAPSGALPRHLLLESIEAL